MLKKILNKLYILLIFTPLCLVRDTYDNDFWFIINHGRYILENGFTNTEPFTIHSDLTFTFEKWLTSISFYKLFEWVGDRGMYIFLAGVFAVILLVMFFTMFRISKNKILSVFFTTAFGFLFVKAAYITLRPQIFSYLLLIIEFYLLERYVQTDNNKFLYFLPLISWLFFQLHSTMWLMFFIVLMPYIFDFNFLGRIIKCEESNYKKIPILISCTISFFVGFLNPYGYQSVFYLFKSLDVTKYPIEELRVPDDIIFYRRMMFFVVFEIIYYLNRNLQKTQLIPLRYLYFLIGTLLMGIMARRNISYFQIYHAIICCYMFKDIKMDFLLKIKNPILVFSIVAMLGTIYCISDKEMSISGLRAERLLDELKEELGCDYKTCQNTTIYTEFNTGAYAEWIGFKTYLDPRAEVFLKKVNNKEDILQEWYEVHYLTGDYKPLEKKYGFDYWLIVDYSKISEKISEDSSYILINEDKNFKLYQYKPS